MTTYGRVRSNVDLLEQFNRRSYVLSKDDQVSGEQFRVLYNGTQSYYSFWPGCRMGRRVRKMLSACHTIEIDNRTVSVIDYDEFRHTGNITMTIVENPLDPLTNTTIYLA